jgi:hypothetical protein
MTTKKSNLAICGGNSDVVTLEQVESNLTPPTTYRTKQNKDGTDSVSHQCIPHIEMINRLRSELTKREFQVEGECHNLAHNKKSGNAGDRYFGLFQVSHDSRKENHDRATVIGLRNAHDKAFSAGICAGDAPFVCDNLIFSNEVTVSRKHTGDYENLLQEVSSKIQEALGKVFGMWNTQDARVDAYKNREITNGEANDLIIKAYQADAVSVTQIPAVLNQWESSDHPEFWDRNMNSLYNAFSETYKGNLGLRGTNLVKRSDGLHSVFDPFAGLLSKETVEVEAETVNT